MDQIKAGTVVAFARRSWDISADKPYTVQEDPACGLFIEDDGGDARYACVQDPDNYQSKGGYIVQHPADPASDTRTALIEALKARLEAVKDAPLHTLENSEQFWIGQALDKAYGIRATFSPGPSTVTFTELANNP
ncbi:hypothetical protein C0V97_12370 [Asaia sp. W19]|uniref:hypothetical protein n=1 Tax=unclassified Asaia TaxID=2685023 RepID=UPI000F8D7CC2|nr:hypothetical protein [Asaia sp. W19]RUT25371.1 hypothetical protein C0V97_12370 [Asaia sp. W19]